MQDLKTDHWAYNAMRKLVAVGLLVPYDESVDLSIPRSRLEMAMLVRKVEAVLEAETFGTSAAAIPAKERVELRLQGLQRQLDSVERIKQAMAVPANDEAGRVAALDFLARSLPPLLTSLKGLQEEYGQAADDGAVTAIFDRIDKEIDQQMALVQQLHTGVSSHAPAAYAQASLKAMPRIAETIEQHALLAANGGEGQDLLDLLRRLEQEFEPELATLSPGSGQAFQLSTLTKWLSGSASGKTLDLGSKLAEFSEAALPALQVSGSTLTRLSGSEVTGAKALAAQDGVPLVPQFDQLINLALNTELPGGTSLSADFSGTSDFLDASGKPIGIDEISLRLKSRSWETEVGTGFEDVSLNELTMRDQDMTGAKAHLNIGRFGSTLVLGRTEGENSSYLAALNGNMDLGENLQVGATLVGGLDASDDLGASWLTGAGAALSGLGSGRAGVGSADGATGDGALGDVGRGVPEGALGGGTDGGSDSSSDSGAVTSGNGQVDASIQAQWQLKDLVTLKSEVAFSALGKGGPDSDNSAMQLTGLTDLYGVNLVTRLHRVDAGFKPRFASSSDSYAADSSGFDVEASSELGPVQFRAGFGGKSQLDGEGATQTQKIGADYGFDFLGAKLKTGVELKSQSGAEKSTTLTRSVTADVPLSKYAAVNAKVEQVDIDQLRDIAVAEENGSKKVTKMGVGGSVQLGESGSLRVGYELAQTIGNDGPSLASTADAGLEYSLSSRARLKAGLNLDTDGDGTRATTNVNLGYDLTQNTMFTADYRLVNFSDMAKGDYRANVAQARLAVKF